MGISSTGIGSGLDVAGIIAKLMAVESAPLAAFDKKTAAVQAKRGALGSLSSALGSFQSSLSSLSSPTTFRAVGATVADKTILGATATSEAAPGTYKVNVTQLAQAQSLNTAGQASMTATLGAGAKTTLTFQFGTVSGGSFSLAGASVGAGTAASGIASGSLTINGTVIATSGATKSASLLADAINAQSATTGVSAVAGATATGAGLFSNFGQVNTAAGTSYALSVNGIQLAQAAGATASVSAGTIDTALATDATTRSALAAANITFSGTAAAGDLQFFAADGTNISITEAVSGGTVSGGIGRDSATANPGSSITATSGVTLASASGSAINIGGSAPGAAGLTAGSGGSYAGAGFTQDGAQASGTVVLDAGDQSLQGIRDAINKAKLGVSASIVSDGSGTPYRLVLVSEKTGASSSMKISVSGDGAAAPDATLANLLAYDPAGTQKLRQSSAAHSALLNVNGIAVTSAGSSVSGAIQGVTLTLNQLGSTSVSVARDSAGVKDSVNAFVKAYNDLNNTIKGLTSYDANTKRAGVLLGDSTVRSIQSQLNQQLGTAVTGAGGKLTTLNQAGIARDKNGNLSVDSTKLQKALSENFGDIAGLFAAIGTASDGRVAFSASSAATKPGVYAVDITHLATRGSLTSGVLQASTVIAANTTWSVTLNQTEPFTTSKVQRIAIPAGTYNHTELASMLRAAINGNAAFAGAGDSVETAVNGGLLSISSSRYGAASNIALDTMSGTPVSDLFGSASPIRGSDVAGTIGGAAATGSGQTLTAASPPAEGLKLTIDSDLPGAHGTISFSQGYAYQLNNLAAGFLGKEGVITNKSDGLDVTIKAVAKSRDAFNERLAATEKRYRAQFTALDTMLASMQSTSSYLSQQLAALANNT